jgi:hypothetical protein
MTLFDLATQDLVSIFLDWGETVTYNPTAAGVADFSCTVLVVAVDLNRLIDRNVVGDWCMAKIQHSVYTGKTLTGPVCRKERTAGDKITRTSLGAVSETWDVIDADYSMGGFWTLTLEKNIRVMPR